jgi:UDP-glucose 4-epimerase
VAAVDARRPGIWNVGTGTETSVLDLVELLGKEAGTAVAPRFAPARPGELPRSALDAARAAADLDWRSRTSLDVGIERTYAWVRAGEPDRGRR